MNYKANSFDNEPSVVPGFRVCTYPELSWPPSRIPNSAKSKAQVAVYPTKNQGCMELRRSVRQSFTAIDELGEFYD